MRGNTTMIAPNCLAVRIPGAALLAGSLLLAIQAPAVAQQREMRPVTNTGSIAMYQAPAPAEPEAKTSAGWNWLRRNKPKEAEINPSQFPYARLCERRGDLAQARRIYESLRDKDPQNQQYHHRLAVLSAREGKLPESDRHFRATFESGPPTAEILSDYGYFLYLQHRLPEAERVLRDGLAMEPHHQSALNNLGLTLGQLGRFEEALAIFRQAGNDAEAHSKLAYIYAQLGEFDRAITHYSHALSFDPTLRSAAEAMLQVHQQKQSLEAVAAHQRAPQQALAGTTAAPPVPQTPFPSRPGNDAYRQPAPPPTAGVELVGQSWSPSAAAMLPPPPALQPLAPGEAVTSTITAGNVQQTAATESYSWRDAGSGPPQSVTVVPYHAAAPVAPVGPQSEPFHFQHVPTAAPPQSAEMPQAAPPRGARITNVRAR
jgi:Tfp pilus assembly protein PilF